MRSSYQRHLKTKESLLWFQESRKKWEQSRRRRVVALPPPLPPYTPPSHAMIEEEVVDPPQETPANNMTPQSKTTNDHQNQDTRSQEEITRDAYRDRLIAFYQEHNPSKLDTVEATLDAFHGKEDLLFQKLEAKYVKSKNTSSITSSPYLPPSGAGPICFLEFTWGDSQRPQRVVIQLFQDKAPLACENFRCLCTGERGTGRSGKPLCYRSSNIHRVVPRFCIQGGDFTKGDGTGGESIYPPNSEHGDVWGKFPDETPFLQHSRKGLLSMANNGPNRNGSQFFFTLRALASLDGKHVVFGEVIEGMDVVDAIGALPTNDKQRPLEPVVITDCGEIKANGQEIRASQSGSNGRDNDGQKGLGGSQLFGSSALSFGNALNFASTSSFATSSFGSSGGSSGFGSSPNATLPNESLPDATKASSCMVQPSIVERLVSDDVQKEISMKPSSSFEVLKCEEYSSIMSRAAGDEFHAHHDMPSPPTHLRTYTSSPLTSNSFLNNADQQSDVVNIECCDKDISSSANPTVSSALPQTMSFRPLGDKLLNISNPMAVPSTLYSSPTSVSDFPGIFTEAIERTSDAHGVEHGDVPSINERSPQLFKGDNSLLLDWERRSAISPRSCIADGIPPDDISVIDTCTSEARSASRAVLDELEVQLTLFNGNGFCANSQLPNALGWQRGLARSDRFGLGHVSTAQFLNRGTTLATESLPQFIDELSTILALQVQSRLDPSSLNQKSADDPQRMSTDRIPEVGMEICMRTPENVKITQPDDGAYRPIVNSDDDRPVHLVEGDNSLLLDWKRRSATVPKPCLSDCLSPDGTNDIQNETCSASTRPVSDELDVELHLVNANGFLPTFPLSRVLDWHRSLLKPDRFDLVSAVTRRRTIRRLPSTKTPESGPQFHDELSTLLALQLQNDSEPTSFNPHSEGCPVRTATDRSDLESAPEVEIFTATPENVVIPKTENSAHLPVYGDELDVLLFLSIDRRGSLPAYESKCSTEFSPCTWNKHRMDQDMDGRFGANARWAKADIALKMEHAGLPMDERQLQLELERLRCNSTKCWCPQALPEESLEQNQSVTVASSHHDCSDANVLPKESYNPDQTVTVASVDHVALRSIQTTSQQSQQSDANERLKGDELSTALNLLSASGPDTLRDPEALKEAGLSQLMFCPLNSGKHATTSKKSSTHSTLWLPLPRNTEAGVHLDEFGVHLSLATLLRANVETSEPDVSTKDGLEKTCLFEVSTNTISEACSFRTNSPDLHSSCLTVDDFTCNDFSLDERHAQLELKIPQSFSLQAKCSPSAVTLIPVSKRKTFTGTSAAIPKFCSLGISKDLALPDELEIALALAVLPSSASETTVVLAGDPIPPRSADNRPLPTPLGTFDGCPSSAGDLNSHTRHSCLDLKPTATSLPLVNVIVSAHKASEVESNSSAGLPRTSTGEQETAAGPSPMNKSTTRLPLATRERCDIYSVTFSGQPETSAEEPKSLVVTSTNPTSLPLCQVNGASGENAEVSIPASTDKPSTSAGAMASFSVPSRLSQSTTSGSYYNLIGAPHKATLSSIASTSKSSTASGALKSLPRPLPRDKSPTCMALHNESSATHDDETAENQIACTTTEHLQSLVRLSTADQSPTSVPSGGVVGTSCKHNEVIFSSFRSKPSATTGELNSRSGPASVDQLAASVPPSNANRVPRKQTQLRVIAFVSKPSTFVDSSLECKPEYDSDSVSTLSSSVKAETPQEPKTTASTSLTSWKLFRPRPDRMHLLKQLAASEQAIFSVISSQTSGPSGETDNNLQQQAHSVDDGPLMSSNDARSNAFGAFSRSETSRATTMGPFSTSLLRTGWNQQHETITFTNSSSATIYDACDMDTHIPNPEMEAYVAKQSTFTRFSRPAVDSHHSVPEKPKPVERVLSIPSNKGLFASVSAFSKPTPSDKQFSNATAVKPHVSDLVTFFEGLTHEYLGDIDLVTSETLYACMEASTTISSSSPTMEFQRGDFSCALPGELSLSPQHSGFGEPAFWNDSPFKLPGDDEKQQPGDGDCHKGEASETPTPDLVATFSSECEEKSECLATPCNNANTAHNSATA